MTLIRTDTAIRRDPQEVFDFVTTPANWPRWHPSSIRVSGDIDHPLVIGERCTEEFVVAGRRGVTDWIVVGSIPGRRWVIEATEGRATITYELTPAEDGTRFVRTLQYTMPNLMLAVLDRLIIRRRIIAESAEALRRLRELLESPTTLSSGEGRGPRESRS